MFKNLKGLFSISSLFKGRCLRKSVDSQNCVQHDTPWTDFSLTPEHLFCTIKVERPMVLLRSSRGIPAWKYSVRTKKRITRTLTICHCEEGVPPDVAIPTYPQLYVGGRLYRYLTLNPPSTKRSYRGRGREVLVEQIRVELLGNCRNFALF
jgi:hypothetical protein